MENVSQNILIDPKDYNTLITQFFTDLSDKNEEYYFDEIVLQSTVNGFLNYALLEIKKNIKSKKKKSELAWDIINKEYEISKLMFSKKLKPFIRQDFKRHTILRDIGNAYSLMSLGFYKETVILSGSVIEEILRLYLISKKMISNAKTFNEYIKICEQNNLFKKGLNKLSDSVREFRNIVHLSKEQSKNDTINPANAKNAVSAIFSVYFGL